MKETDADQDGRLRAFRAGFVAARELESFISEDGPWHPKYRTADEAWAAEALQVGCETDSAPKDEGNGPKR